MSKIKTIQNWLSDEHWQIKEHDIARFSAIKSLNGIDYSFYCRVDAGRLKVTTSTIRSSVDDYYWTPETQDITISMDKTEDQIFKDLKKRFISKFQEDVDQLIIKTIEPHYEYVKSKQNRMKQALEILGLKDDFKKDEIKGYLANNETYISLKHYSTGFLIELDTINLEQLQKINDIILKG